MRVFNKEVKAFMCRSVGVQAAQIDLHFSNGYILIRLGMFLSKIGEILAKLEPFIVVQLETSRLLAFKLYSLPNRLFKDIEDVERAIQSN